METKIVILLGIVVVSAGCTDIATRLGVDGDVPGENPDVPEKTGKGLEIKDFTVSDHTLQPDQQAVVTLRLKNYHTESGVTVTDTALYNLGFLDVVDTQPCSPPVRPAEQEVYPETVCRWTIQAPPKDKLTGFNSKSFNIRLNLVYESMLSNSGDPFKAQFRSIDDIEVRQEQVRTYANNEVKMTVSGENPFPIIPGQTDDASVKVKLESVGSGNLRKMSGPDEPIYEVEWTPDAVFNDCDGEPEPLRLKPVIENRIEFFCDIESNSGSQVERNLIFSTSYKYAKSPSLDIEVVNRQ